MPRPTKEQVANREAEQAAIKARQEALAEDRKTLQELDETLNRKITPALRFQVLKLRDEIAVRLQQRTDAEAQEAQQRRIEREQADAATQATIAALTQELQAVQTQTALLENDNRDL